MGFYIISFLIVCLIVWFTKKNKILFFLLIFFLIFIIGFRYKVGCDWFNYLRIYTYDAYFNNLFPPHSDILYDFLNYLSNKLGLGIFFVNFIVASILVLGVFLFSKSREFYPYLIIYSVPYLFFVVGMGYTRQALALGFIFLALYFFEKKKEILGNINLFLAFLSHKTTIVLLFLFLIFKPNWFIFLIFLLALAMFLLPYKTSISHFHYGYIEQKMQSKGFLLRFLQTSIIILPYLFFKRLKEKTLNHLYLPFVILYLSILPIVLLTKSSTVADRFLLYTYPLQLYAINEILKLYKRNFFIKVSIILISFAILFIWFKFATHRHCWIPYKNILFDFNQIL